MIIEEVNNDQKVKDFLGLPVMIYKNDDQWIRPLDKDIEAVFDHKKNKFFRQGEAVRWIIYNEKGKACGRIAAFYNRKSGKGFEQPTGGVGFFESINDQNIANRLFDHAKSWLEQKGMEAMDGPVNFGEKDRWWGLLINGFTEPVYCMNYNPPYYQQLFENYGFRNFYEQYYYNYPVKQVITDKYQERSQRIEKDPDYSAAHLKKSEIDKYAEQFREVYNKSWGKHAGFKPMAKEQAMSIMKTIKPIMDEDIIWFAYYKNEPIAFFIMLPEINQIFKHINNGKLRWIEMLRFAWLKYRGVCRKMFGVVFGVIPEFQGKGVESYIINEAAKHVQPLNRYDDLEMTWIGSFNPKMIHLVESLGTEKTRVAVTYRYLFDQTKEFKPHPIID